MSVEESLTIIRDVFSTPTMWAFELKATGENEAEVRSDRPVRVMRLAYAL